MITANERRNQEIEYMSRKREFTLQNLMDEFGISKSTAQRDIGILMSDPYYIPIGSMSGHGGGYCIVGNWRSDHKYLTPIQSELLHRLSAGLQPTDLKVMESILRTFDVPA